MDHPNTAMGIHAVWFAVHDTEAQLRTLRDAGLEAGESREAKSLGAHGREVKAGQGVLLLLESSDKNTRTACLQNFYPIMTKTSSASASKWPI